MTVSSLERRGLIHDDYAYAAIDELPAIWDGLARLVRESLGITAFGVQVIDLPPDYVTDPHDEVENGQQELYVGLAGSGAVVVHRDGYDDRVPLEPGRLAAMAPGASRTLVSGPSGLRILCVGATPGVAYSAPDWTRG